MDLFTSCLKTVEKCLKDAKMEKSSIHDVVLVGGSTNQRISNLVLLNVTPLSLGVEVKGSLMSVIIPRNTTIPNSMLKIYQATKDYLTDITIRVFEGERPRSTDNNLLGEFLLSGLTSTPRGEVSICVTFKIDANLVLNVSAEEKATGVKKSISIIKNGKLTRNEIERMIEDATKYRAEDTEFERRTKARCAFENFAYNRRNALRAKHNLKTKVEKAINQAIGWVNANPSAEVETYESKKKELEAICNPIIECKSKLLRYQQTIY